MTDDDELKMDTDESLSNFESITPDIVAAMKQRVQGLDQGERAGRRERAVQTKVFVWQSRATTIISFGDRSRTARTLVQSSLQLTDRELELLAGPHDFAAFIGEPKCFDNREGGE